MQTIIYTYVSTKTLIMVQLNFCQIPALSAYLVQIHHTPNTANKSSEVIYEVKHAICGSVNHRVCLDTRETPVTVE